MAYNLWTGAGADNLWVTSANWQNGYRDTTDQLKIQGDGDKDVAAKIIKEKGIINDALQNDLNKISKKGIPVDVVFEQGIEYWNLK